ncbi:DUF2493 domain-containing protein [Novosphingobium olei]|uniref:DUF2493 domain-containing protein n=1 Tax=Novosphingobium olei TaxID=2728851 RepID=A0A7Y0GBG4_9SPHN|nr:DUF2493 domain-containing protein [Novosphingobium olei]NML96095.1 DUF2493 domain-containing protein [Novosphingobium olei]
MQTFSNFADLANFIAEETGSTDQTSTYAHAFIEHDERAKLSIVDEAEVCFMPDPDQARAAVEMVMTTLFDVLRDTRLEPFAADLAWGFANSFHVVAKRIEGREDDAAKELGELVRISDPSEIHATQVEDTRLLCETLQSCREAMECMRDHAAQVFHAETGRPFSTARGSRVSSATTASQIEARDFLAARAAKRREAHAPTGPVVIFSGGDTWHDHELLYKALDDTFARIPSMILATTAQHRGCDQIAHAWAASRGVATVRFTLNRAMGKRAGFARNEQMMNLKPVHAVICEGSGLQANLLTRVREAGIPYHAFAASHQQPAFPEGAPAMNGKRRFARRGAAF